VGGTRSWLRSGRDHYRNHGSAVVRIGIISAVGILASFAFQIVTARWLGPVNLGIMSSFFAIVSMAAIGSSSLQNAVAAQTARLLVAGAAPTPRRLDGFTIEALVLGGAGALAVVCFSPLIATSLATETYVPLLAAVSILLSFLFARIVGSIQGTGDSQGAVWWSTVSLVLRVALVGAVLLAGLGLIGALVSVLLASAVACVGAFVYARRSTIPLHHRPFGADGVVVIAMSIAFAWLTNIDLILVRAEADEYTAGVYAAAAQLVKSGFLIPATLSLYLLPRFVRQSGNTAMTRLGVRFTLGVTAAGAALMVAFFGIAGSFVMSVLFGTDYATENWLLVGLSVAYLPWIMAQGQLIRMNALASRTALAVLIFLMLAQFLAATFALPNIAYLLVVIGATGTVALVVFLIIDSRAARHARATHASTTPGTEPAGH